MNLQDGYSSEVMSKYGFNVGDYVWDGQFYSNFTVENKLDPLTVYEGRELFWSLFK